MRSWSSPTGGSRSGRPKSNAGSGGCSLGLGFAVITELPLATGRRADMVAVNKAGAIWIVEIKSSIEDFRADTKWPDYWADCDRLFFAIPHDVSQEIMPAETGLIVADRYGAEVIIMSIPRQPMFT